MEETWLQHPCARILLLLLSLAVVYGQTSTPAPAHKPCSFYSKRSCEECLKNVSCLWCTTNNSCLDYPVKTILPPSSVCPLSDARWGACWINFEALIIAMSVVAGAILLGITICCCYCCYCRKSSSAGRLEAEEETLILEREKRKQESLQRKNERTIKHNEIRKKYGLLQDMDHPYSKFEE
ncbi:pituitary tumor-transforming gene 1 protein-interacting protein-like [Hyperolius riggenbachi]|uniref:pituitary tumor-transforming gene 1 protein-interacting protein-like n=1 Tax=Hyperolius riggenbachi TaxID=752182 RepID=UPI0035A3CA38